MPQLNFNVLARQGPMGVVQGFEQGQQLRNQMLQQKQQEQLAELQMQNALREQRMAGEEEAAYKAAGSDMARLQQELMSRGLGKQSMAVGAQIAKQQTDKMAMLKQQHDLVKTAAAQVQANPENAIQILQSFGQRTGIDMNDDIALLQTLGNDPARVQKWAASIAMEADKLTPKFQQFSVPGVGVKTGTVDPLTGKFVEGQTYKEEISPYQTEQLKISRGQLGVAQVGLALRREELARQRDPEFQRQMEYAKSIGQLAAKGDVAAKQEFPKLVAQANEAVQLVDQLVGKAPVKDASGKVIQPGTAPHPGFKSAVGMGDVYTLGIPGVAQLTPGTDAADFKALYDQVKSGAFLQAFQAIKGAGAITEKEGEKATAAITRMSLAQSEDEFLKAAREFQNNVRLGVRNAEQKVMNAGGVRPSAAPAQPGASKPTVSNW